MRTDPWDFMVKDTPSKDWIHGSGVFIAIAFFCGGIAGGGYLVSLYFNNLWGLFVSWLFALAMGMFDMAHLHDKKLAWRIVLRPHSSWISRGFLFVTAFIGAAAIQMAISKWAPGTGAETFFKVIAGITAFGVATYSGFVLSYVTYIKIWNSTIMPVLFIVTGLAGGSSILLLISSITGTTQFDTIKYFTASIIGVYGIMIALHLWVTSYAGPTSEHSVRTIVKGELAGLFWGVIVTIGVVAPVIMTLLSNADLTALLAVNVVFVLAGNMALRYSIMKAAYYRPLLPA